MFSVTAKNNNYTVRFTHPIVGKNKRQRRMTACNVVVVNPVSGGSLTLLGKSICQPPDQFIKAVGRKRAFADAVRLFDREVRATLWAAYWAHTRKGGHK